MLTLDFETYYDRIFHLKQKGSGLEIDEYVQDKRFKIWGVAVKFEGQEAQWWSGRDVLKLKDIDWANIEIVCHNAYFDCYILWWWFKVKPALIRDTMCMGKALYPAESNSLEALAERRNVGKKGIELKSMMGRRDLTGAEDRKLGGYAKNDINLTEKLYLDMLPEFPESELEVIDATIRMHSEPALIPNRQILEEHLLEVQREKEETVLAVRHLFPPPSTIQTFPPRPVNWMEHIRPYLLSNQKFAEILDWLGVDAPTKESLATGEETLALAKGDRGFLKLQEHENPDVQALVKARMAIKSTIEETRTESFLKRSGFPLAIQLWYYGSHTGRFCMKPSAEVLTPNGWTTLENWDGEEPIMQYWKDGFLSWCENPVKNEFDFTGNLINVKSHYHDASYTPEHLIPKITSKNKFSLVKIDKANRGFDIPISGVIRDSGVGINTWMLRLIVATQADGSIRTDTRQGRCIRFGFNKERKIERLRLLLNNLNIPYTEHDNWSSTKKTFVIKWVDAPDVLKTCKTLPSWFFCLDATQINTVLYEIGLWDGYLGDKGINYYTNNKHNAETIATLAHLVGKASKISIKNSKSRKESWNTSYVVYIRDNNKTRYKPNMRTSESYDGKVYCPTTNTGMFLCRSEGQIIVTGNSGGGGMNLQNLPRGSALRKCLEAPEGYQVVVADLSQIEARLNMWLAWAFFGGNDGVKTGLDTFATGGDIYSQFASTAFGFEVKKKEHPTERFVGKTCVLGLGYQMSPPKLKKQLEVQGGLLLPTEETERLVKTYRTTYYQIPKQWYFFHDSLEVMLHGEKEVKYGPITFRRGGIVLPNGLSLKYRGLSQSKTGEWSYITRKGGRDVRTNLYGGKICENVVQALARIIICDAMVKVSKRYKIVLQVHDEIIFLAPTKEADEALKWAIEQMTVPPEWAKDVPLAAEGGWDKGYSK